MFLLATSTQIQSLFNLWSTASLVCSGKQGQDCQMCYVGCSHSKTSKSCQEKPPLHPSLTQKHRKCPAGSDLLGHPLSSAPSKTVSSTGEHIGLATACTSFLSCSPSRWYPRYLWIRDFRFILVSVFSTCLGLAGIFSKPVFLLMISSVSSPKTSHGNYLMSSPSMM